MKTSIGTEIPEYIEKKKGRGKLKPFEGAWTRLRKGWMDEPSVSLPTKAKMPHAGKMERDLKTAIEKTNPRDGMTVSFHHHLRNGDAIVNCTMDILAELGITYSSARLSRKGGGYEFEIIFNTSENKNREFVEKVMLLQGVREIVSENL